MARLTCLNLVTQWEHNQASKYPEISLFIEKLKNDILKKPDSGLPAPTLSVKGKILPCLKKSVNISMFSYQYALGYNFITATYVYNENDILIIKMYYS